MSSRARKPCCGQTRVVTAAKGLVTITRAELLRQINPIPYQRAWMRMCEGCLSSQRHAGVLWCGTPLVDRSDHPDPTQRTCGCVCREKARIAGSECPQGKHAQITVSANHT
jgi:hypothetical protein